MTRDLARVDLDAAHRAGSAVGAFTVYNLEQARGVVNAAEAEGTPVILQAGASAFRYVGRAPLAALAIAVAQDSDAAVGVHLDHSRDLEEIRACLLAGYGSVMFDGSHLPLEANIAGTRRVVAEAHAAGAWVEAELAGIGGDEDRSTAAPDAHLTDPAVAERFVEETGVDALAVSIGNVHGIPETPVRLDLELLARIRDRVPVPLVLHGASGLSDHDVVGAIGLGIAKVNVNTELRRAFRAALLRVAGDPPPGDDLASFLAPGVQAVEAAAREKIRLFAAGARSPEGGA